MQNSDAWRWVVHDSIFLVSVLTHLRLIFDLFLFLTHILTWAMNLYLKELDKELKKQADFYGNCTKEDFLHFCLKYVDNKESFWTDGCRDLPLLTLQSWQFKTNYRLIEWNQNFPKMIHNALTAHNNWFWANLHDCQYVCMYFINCHSFRKNQVRTPPRTFLTTFDFYHL